MTQTLTSPTKKKRLLSLDILRGITVAGMILVNNPGSWAHIYAPLRHAAWNGCTPTDLVFPFFVFCMGVAMYISHSKSNFELNWSTARKIIVRGLLIILIGWALSWYGMALRQFLRGADFVTAMWTYPVANIRYLGVFPRLGLVSLLGGLLLLTFKPKRILWVSAALMLIYSILQSVTNSFELTAQNMESIVDLKLLGDDHIYHMRNAAGERIGFDPEGVLSTITCVAHVLIGAWVGKLIMTEKDLWSKVTRALLAGAIMMILGFCLDYAYPINKAMWSASYILVTCGLASCILGILTWILDIRLPQLNEVKPTTTCAKVHHAVANNWYKFFETFGVNPLFIFCLSTWFVVTAARVRFEFHEKTYNLLGFWYSECLQPIFGDKGGSLVSALSLVLLMWAIGYVLYRKKIYIKL
jgi:predicted acyltransferase